MKEIHQIYIYAKKLLSWNGRHAQNGGKGLALNYKVAHYTRLMLLRTLQIDTKLVDTCERGTEKRVQC